MEHQNDLHPLVAPLASLNYLHEAHQYIDKNLTVMQVYNLMTGHPPFWLRIAFKIRDFLSLKFGGVQPIKGFSSVKPENVSINEKLDFFDVVKITDKELYLQSTDKHLSVLVALQLQEHNEQENELTVTTSVITYNLFGKIYMLPVSLVHDFIVKNSLKNLNQSC
ncbi:conserved hypothetical protein [Acinetobacter proteolyticus]|uniref:DUF2867 domain-containing protein n=1 Tax=Acinetobacter proteolyticus TaxID=1776741 RepID=A0A653K170_9GAMM|nr:DUF2867 domain-containing protein [Acinetobacter proteolyticus]VXA54473.1 conserved hypothetical protein [Acinetobacter proteolyticus]